VCPPSPHFFSGGGPLSRTREQPRFFLKGLPPISANPKGKFSHTTRKVPLFPPPLYRRVCFSFVFLPDPTPAPVLFPPGPGSIYGRLRVTSSCPPFPQVSLFLASQKDGPLRFVRPPLVPTHFCTSHQHLPCFKRRGIGRRGLCQVIPSSISRFAPPASLPPPLNSHDLDFGGGTEIPGPDGPTHTSPLSPDPLGR